MSEFKGTPAPWKLANGQKDMVVTDRPLGEGQVVAATYGDNMPENAMLIAAAPDLLEHLQKIVGYCEDPEWRGNMTARQMAKFMDGVRAECLPLIAKALGQ